MRGNKTLRKLSILVLAAAMLLNSTYLSAFAVDTAKEAGDSNPAAAEEKASSDEAEVQVEEVTAPAKDESGTPADTKSDAESEDPGQDVQADDPQTEENGDDQAAGSVTEPAAAEDEQTADDPAVEEPSESTEDEVETFPVKITLVDADGNPVKGATLTLEDAGGKIIKDKDDKEIGKWVTSDKEDEKDYELQLESGDYVLKTDKVPSGYKVLEDEIKIKVDDDGKVEIEKAKDEDGKEIESALAYKKDADDKDIENELLLTIEKEKAKSLLKAPRKAPASGSDPHFNITWEVEPVDQTITLNGTDNTNASIVPVTDSNNEREQHVKAVVHFSMGYLGKKVEAGEVKISLPKQIFTDWNGDKTGETIVGVGKKSMQSGKNFWYYYADDDGNEVPEAQATQIILENYTDLGDPNGDSFEFACEIAYGYMPSKVNEDEKIELKAKYQVAGFEERQNLEEQTLTADINTKSQLESVSKSSHNVQGDSTQFDEWKDSWGTAPSSIISNTSDYYYVAYDVVATVDTDSLTQPFTLSLNEKPGNNGKMVGFSQWSNSSSNVSMSNVHAIGYTSGSSTTYPATGPVKVVSNMPSDKIPAELKAKDTTGYSRITSNGLNTISSKTFRTTVLVAYPKENGKVPVDKTITNSVDVTKTPVGKDAAETKSADTSWKVRDLTFIYEGDMFRIDKYNQQRTQTSSSSYISKSGAEARNAKYLLENGSSAGLVQWLLIPSARGFALSYKADHQKDANGNNISGKYLPVLDANGNPTYYGKYVVEAIDDQLYLDGELLQPGDYTFVDARWTYVGFNPSWRTIDVGEFKFNFDSMEVEKVTNSSEYTLPDVYYRTSATGNWILFKEQSAYGETVYFPDNAYQIKYSWETDSYSIRPLIYTTAKLNPTDHVLDIISKTEKPSLRNVDTLRAVDTKGNVANKVDENTMGGSSELKDQVKDHDQSGKYGDGGDKKTGNGAGDLSGDNYLQHDAAQQYLTSTYHKTAFSKRELSDKTKDDDDNRISYRTYQLRSAQALYFNTDTPNEILNALEQRGVEHGQKSILFYDLLPEGAELNKDSLAAMYYERTDGMSNDPNYNVNLETSTGDSGTKVEGTVGDVQTIDNWKDTNRTLVIIPVTFPEGQDPEWGQKYDADRQVLQLGTTVTLDLEVVYDWENIALYGKNVTNYGVAYLPGTGEGSPDDLSNATTFRDNLTDITPDVLTDLNRDGNGGGEGDDYYYSKVNSSFVIANAAMAQYRKRVKSSIESTYRQNSAEVSYDPDVEGKGIYSYEFRYKPVSGTKASNIIIYDVLEYAYVSNNPGFAEKLEESNNRHWEGTFDHVNVAQPGKLGANVVVYYSTTDKKTLYEGLDKEFNPDSTSTNFAVANSTYWMKATADQINALSDAEKAKITAIAFDLTERTNGGAFKLDGDKDTDMIVMYIYMKAPDAKNVLDYNGEGPLMDPAVYAYNNSFRSLSMQIGNGSIQDERRLMSDGTTIRVAEPTPEITKKVTDADEETIYVAGDSTKTTDSVKLDKRDEVFKYTINTKVPIMGNNAQGQEEYSKYILLDELESVLQIVKDSEHPYKITIGNPYNTTTNSFVYDSSTGTWTMKLDGANGMETTTGTYTDNNSSGSTGQPNGLKWWVGNSTYSDKTLKLLLTYTGDKAETYYTGTTTNDPPASTVTYDRVKEFGGLPIEVEFWAKIRDGVSLGKYASNDNKVPNTAKYILPGKNTPDSNTVYVSPPPEEPPVPKKSITELKEDGTAVDKPQKFYILDKDGNVKTDEDTGEAIVVYRNNDGAYVDENDEPVSVDRSNGERVKTLQEIENLNQVWEYKIEAAIPGDANRVTLSDTLVDALEFANGGDEPKVKISGTVDINGTPTKFSKELTWKEVQALSNSASYGFGSSAEGLSASLTAQTVSLTLGIDFINKFGDYIVDSTQIIDPDTGNISIQQGSSAVGKSSDAGFALAGFNIEVTFHAKIKDSYKNSSDDKDTSKLNDYATENGIEIPNTANYQINNKPSVTSDPVVITPPTPDIFKRVNNKMHEDLLTTNQKFTYSINTLIPDSPIKGSNSDDEEVTSFKVADTLEPVLEFQTVQTDEETGVKTLDSLNVKILRADGTILKELTPGEVANGLTLDDTAKANKLTFELGAALTSEDEEGNKTSELSKYLSKNYRLLITFDAHIIDGTTEADLDQYIKTDVALVPNKATYQINNNPEVESNTVTVTPPPIGKTVNGSDNYDLGGLDEIVEYRIDTRLPKAATDNEETTFTISDDLVSVLEIVNKNKIKAEIADENGTLQDVTADANVTTEVDEEENHHIKWVIPNDTIQANKERTVVLTFYAKIKDGADLSRYLQREDRGIPNEGKYTLHVPNEPDETVTSKPVTITPPPIGKLVNDKKHEDLKAEDEVFKYTVSVLVPGSPMIHPTDQTSQDVTKFKVIDELVDELELANKNDTVIELGGKTYKMSGRDLISSIGTLNWDETKGTISFDLNEDLIAPNSRTYLELTFYAKIKAGADLSKYEDESGDPLVPNTAKYRINDDQSWEKESNEVTVTPPDVEKIVNGKNHEELDSLAQTFTYTISGKVPKEIKDDPSTDIDETVRVKLFKLTDTLEKVLEFANSADTKVLVDSKEDEDLLKYVTRGTVTAGSDSIGTDDGTESSEGSDDTGGESSVDDTQYVLTFELPEDVISKYADKKISVVFDARIKDGADLSSYISEDSGEIEVPNVVKRTIKINDNPEEETESQPVTVTPPPIDKLVNGKDREDLGTPDEVFTYRISTLIPTAEKASSFKVKDKLESVLEYLPATKIITIGGEDRTSEFTNNMILNKTANEITLTLNKKAIEKYGGQTITVEFDAKIKNGADLSKYKVEVKDEDGNKTEETQIPNKARYQLDNKKEISSEPVIVVPPEVGKTVNGKQHVDLADWDEVFTYKISGYIPNPAAGEEVTKAELSDTLESVLEFTENDATIVTVNGKTADVEVKREGQKLTVDLIPLVATNKGQLVTVEFKAKIKSGTTLDDLADYVNDVSETEVPNEAVVTVKIGDGPEEVKKSKPVTVTPPPLDKKVNGKDHENLSVSDEVFIYSIKSWIPVADNFDQKAMSFIIKDVLEGVLEFDGDVHVQVDGTDVTGDVVIDKGGTDPQTLLVTIGDEIIEANPKKQVVVTFGAKIKADADLSPYENDDGIKVPNKATYQINNDSEVGSNTVTITPPLVEKEVNNKKHEDLKTRDEVFEYEISGFLPEYLEVDDEGKKVLPTKFVLSDTLVDELEYVDDDKAKVLVGSTKGKETEKADLLSNIKVEGQTVVFELKDNQIKDYLGQYILVTFDAKIKDGANLAKYADANGDVKVPNKATLKLDDDPKWTLESNTVTITPPDPKEPPIEKLVNDKQHEDLKTRTEVFEYKIKTAIPADAVSFVITDTLVDELEFTEPDATSVVIGSEKLTADEVSKQIKIDGQKLTLELTKEQLETSERAVVLTFKAKVRDGVDLGKYKVNGKPQVPNIAGYEFENASGEKVKKDSDEVTVTPPDPENPPLEKKANDKYYVEDGAERKSITYTITSRIPLDADKFEIVDELEDVLEFTNVSGTKVLIDGEELSTYQRDALIKRSGQKISLTFTKKLIQANPEKEITLVFEAMTKKGADLSAYNVDGHIIIPNTAGYIINDDPKTARNSNTVTVKIPEPPIKITTENKPTSKDTPGTGVKTGDTTRIIVWIVLLVLAALMAGAVVVRRRLSKK